jgi:hypothetical protein
MIGFRPYRSINAPLSGMHTIPGAVNAVIIDPIVVADTANGATKVSSSGNTSAVPSGPLTLAIRST